MAGVGCNKAKVALFYSHTFTLLDSTRVYSYIIQALHAGNKGVLRLTSPKKSPDQKHLDKHVIWLAFHQIIAVFHVWYHTAGLGGILLI